MTEIDPPCELDPSNAEHVSAVHEGGHAIAAERSGCRLTHVYLLAIAGTRSHGDTTREAPPNTTPEQLANIDRAIAVAGAAAELRFAGSTDDEACKHDREVAAEITRQLRDRNLEASRLP